MCPFSSEHRTKVVCLVVPVCPNPYPSGLLARTNGWEILPTGGQKGRAHLLAAERTPRLTSTSPVTMGSIASPSRLAEFIPRSTTNDPGTARPAIESLLRVPLRPRLRLSVGALSSFMARRDGGRPATGQQPRGRCAVLAYRHGPDVKFCQLVGRTAGWKRPTPIRGSSSGAATTPRTYSAVS